MLYHLHEMNRALMAPLTNWADFSSKLFSNPISPLAHTPFSQRIAAGYELMFRLGKKYEKPEFNIHTTTVNNDTVEVVEKVELHKTFCRLLHFKKTLSSKQAKQLDQPKVLLV